MRVCDALPCIFLAHYLVDPIKIKINYAHDIRIFNRFLPAEGRMVAHVCRVFFFDLCCRAA